MDDTSTGSSTTSSTGTSSSSLSATNIQGEHGATPKAPPTSSPTPLPTAVTVPVGERGPESVRSPAGPAPATIANPAAAPALPPSMPTSSAAIATGPVSRETAASLDDPKLFLNRELSWLAFNMRVLEEARSPTVPMVERLKFVAIVASNLDEFFMVRVAGLKQQLSGDVEDLPADGMSVHEQLTAIAQKVHELVRGLYGTLRGEIFPALAQVGVRILEAGELSEEQRREIEGRFLRDVFPILTPLAIDPGHPFPHLRNNTLNLAVAFQRDPRDEDAPGLGVVQVPMGIPRLVQLSSPPGQRWYVLLEDIISLNASTIFPMQRIEGCWPFRVTRNWDLALDEEEAEDLTRPSSRSFDDAIAATRCGSTSRSRRRRASSATSRRR